MTDDLSKIFDEESAPPQVIGAEEYRRLLERLLTQGQGFGKSQPVAAHLLHDINIGTEKETPAGLKEGEERIKVESLYVVMDLKEWPNAYVRALGMKEIGMQYMARMVGEKDMNAHDFKAPGLWTVKKKAFEADYLPRPQERDEFGNLMALYDPNPEKFRLCLPIEKTTVIPVPWGEWTIGAGGTLAVRQEDIASLAAALLLIRNEEASAQEALYTTDGEGNTVSRFDVYGMMPGFRETNYDPVTLAPETLNILARFSRLPSLDDPPKVTAGKPEPPQL